MNTINTIEKLLGFESFLWFAVIVVALLFMTLYSLERRRGKIREKEIGRIALLDKKIQGSKPLEDNLKAFLEILANEIKAAYYAFYALDNRGEKYLLRAAIHPFDDFSKVGPSYSGLALSRREVYIPPVSMDYNQGNTSFEVTKIGEAEFILLTSFSEHAVVRIGPIRKLNRKTKRNLRMQFKSMEPRIEELIEVYRNQAAKPLSITADKVVRTIASMATSIDSALEIMMRSLIGEVGGSGGFLVDPQGDLLISVDFEDDFSALPEKIRNDQKFRSDVESWLRNRNYHMVSSRDAEYYSLPEYIVSHGIGALLAICIPNRGTLFLLFDLNFDREGVLKQGVSKIGMIADVFWKISQEQKQQKWMAKVYIQQLKRITDAVEIVNPFSVGYAEMAAHFSLVIGKELGLPEITLENLALAAYFSNVGTLGMDRRVFNKQGRLSEAEYEQVKLHSEIGAAMILIATGNREASEFVLYHHERIDGNGYPQGLQNEEIPIGARIIHVVQFLLAKINGRSWRNPVSFAKALEVMQAMSGTQLDRKVVDAFLSWYYKKAGDRVVEGKPLDVCHRLCSVPQSICSSCPVYKKVRHSSVNCWEVGNNLCQAHGRSCETCFVRTEYLDRERLKKSNQALSKHA